MNLAPLQLAGYWVERIQVGANPEYRHHEPAELHPDIITINVDVRAASTQKSEAHDARWEVRLSLRQSLVEGKNIPYEFFIQIAGLVAVHPSLKGEKLKRAVEVNGPSMLFGAAREIIRATTGMGPFPALLIPSVSFLKPSDAPKKSAIRSEKTSATRKATGKSKKPAD